jgi:hypothetical protein
MGAAWDRTPRERALATQFVIHFADNHVQRFALGAHAPVLRPEDVEHIHRVWVDAVKLVGPGVHHRDVVVVALASLEDDLRTKREQVVARLRRQVEKPGRTD